MFPKSTFAHQIISGGDYDTRSRGVRAQLHRLVLMVLGLLAGFALSDRLDSPSNALLWFTNAFGGGCDNTGADMGV